MKKNNYIATAWCDGLLKHFTVHNATDAHATRVAKNVASSLFCATCISVVSLTVIK